MSSGRPKTFSARLYVLAVVILAFAALVVSVRLDPTLSTGLHSASGILAFTALGLGLQWAERRLGVASVSGAISFIVFIAGALVFGPTWGAIITMVSLAAVHTIRRFPLIKIAFNAGQHGLAIIAGSFVYMMLGGQFPPESLDGVILPFFALVLAFFSVNTIAVSGIVAVSEGRRFADVWISNTWSFALYDLAASSVSLAIVWLYAHTPLGPFGIAVVVLPVLFIRHVYLVNQQLQDTNRELLELMVKAIEARDPYTSGHSQRVSDIARILARAIGLGFRDVESIATAGLLHDVGKIHEEYAPLLRKEGKLTVEEKGVMDSHAARSAELVATISQLRGPVERSVRHHHENYDGTGYPDGLSGDEIPMGARIIAIADTADAMTTDRPYRKALNYDKVLSVLARFSWKQFDPRLVSIFRTSPEIREMMKSRLHHHRTADKEPPEPVIPLRSRELARLRGAPRSGRRAEDAGAVGELTR